MISTYMRHDYRKVRYGCCLQDIIAISLSQMRYDCITLVYDMRDDF